MPGSRRARAAVAAGLVALVAPVVAACDTSSPPPDGPSASRPTSASPAAPAPSTTRSTTPTTTPTERTRGNRPRCTLAREVRAWPVRRLAWQTVVVPTEQQDLAAVTDQVAAGAGGVILFGSESPDDLGAQLRTLSAQAPHGLPPLVMSDEEGGAVQRLVDLVGRLPSAREMGATLAPREIRALAERLGTRMADAGVTANLAPVLDLDGGPGPDETHPIGTRSFGTDAGAVTADGLAFARGLRAAGVLPVVKHFPGLGGATANTDVTAARSRPWAELRRRDLEPFAAAVDAGLPAVMVSNARVPGLTAAPAGLSPAVVRGVLRRQLGFRGLVITDSLSAGAIRDAGYAVPRASVRALQAGADMILFNADPASVGEVAGATVRAVVAAVRAGDLPRSRLRSAVVHVLEAKQARLCG